MPHSQLPTPESNRASGASCKADATGSRYREARAWFITIGRVDPIVERDHA